MAIDFEVFGILSVWLLLTLIVAYAGGGLDRYVSLGMALYAFTTETDHTGPGPYLRSSASSSGLRV